MPMSRDEAMQKIAEAAQSQTLIGFGSKLKEMFGEENCSFITEPLCLHRVKSPDGGDDITVISKTLVSDPDYVVGDIAIG